MTTTKRSPTNPNSATSERAPVLDLDPDSLPMAVSGLVGTGDDARREIHLGPLTLVAFLATGPDNALVHDLELGRWLAYAEPRMIRRLIKRVYPGFRGVHCRSTVERQLTNGGGVREYVVKEYWLTHTQALRVAMRAETADADVVQEFVAKVFLAVARGVAKATAPVLDPAIAAAIALIPAMSQQIEGLQRHAADRDAVIARQGATIAYLNSELATGVIGPDVAEQEVREPLRLLARLQSDDDKGYRSALRRNANLLGHYLGFVGRGSKWGMLPRKMLEVAQRHIAVWIDEAIKNDRQHRRQGREAARRAASERQYSLFGAAPQPN